MTLFNCITQGTMAILCTISLWNVPSYTYADCCPPTCCTQQDDCCEERGGWWSGGAGRNALIIGGAAVVGGIAGAIAGNATGGGKGKHGEVGRRGPRGFTGDPGATGATGPAGPSSFTTDAAGTLTFSSTLSLGVALLESVSVIPFVSYPDGHIVYGPQITTTSPISSLAISPIVIGAGNPATPPLVRGTYEYGVQLVPSAGLSLVGLTASLLPTVVASRNSSTTGILVPATLGVATLVVNNQSQMSVPFTYDLATVPSP